MREAEQFPDVYRCSICGLMYATDVDEDRRLHRARHAKVLRIISPKPQGTLAQAYARHGEFVPIERSSPPWMRRRLWGVAVQFKRELGFDFAPYHPDDNDLKGHHWLIVTEDGRSIGGLSVRWVVFSDAPPQWLWTWIWVVPSERRKGWASRCWNMLAPRFSGIDPDPPLSPPIARFFLDRTDVSEFTRNAAPRTLDKFLVHI